MSENSKIQWCDHTFNPWIGCTKVSPGCANCYAEARDKRHLIEKVDHWGKGAPRLRTSASNWKQPLKWDRQRAEESQRENRCVPKRRVFCASLSDWLDDEVPIEWLADLLALIHATPNLDWQLLTKRPENFGPRLRHVYQVCRPWEFVGPWLKGNPPNNVWIGTSVEDQTRADERIPALLEIPAKIRFLSCEPLLGHISLVDVHDELAINALEDKKHVDWVIVGGESGHGARSCDVQWIRSLVAQCKASSVAVFVKQLGAGVYGPDVHSALLDDPKGGEPSEWPEDLRVREFPDLSGFKSPVSGLV